MRFARNAWQQAHFKCQLIGVVPVVRIGGQAPPDSDASVQYGDFNLAGHGPILGTVQHAVAFAVLEHVPYNFAQAV